MYWVSEEVFLFPKAYNNSPDNLQFSAYKYCRYEIIFDVKLRSAGFQRGPHAGLEQVPLLFFKFLFTQTIIIQINSIVNS